MPYLNPNQTAATLRVCTLKIELARLLDQQENGYPLCGHEHCKKMHEIDIEITKLQLKQCDLEIAQIAVTFIKD